MNVNFSKNCVFHYALSQLFMHKTVYFQFFCALNEMESQEFAVVIYFYLCFQWFKPSLRFRPRRLNRFLSSCVLTCIWNISNLRIWNRAPVVSIRRTAAPWVPTHTKQLSSPSQQQPPWTQSSWSWTSHTGSGHFSGPGSPPGCVTGFESRRVGCWWCCSSHTTEPACGVQSRY